MAYECAGYGRASVPPVPTAVGQGLFASPAGLDSRRGGRQPGRAAPLNSRLLPVPVRWGDFAQQTAQWHSRLLSVLQRLAQAPRYRLTKSLFIWQVYLYNFRNRGAHGSLRVLIISIVWKLIIISNIVSYQLFK